ncbi:MAG: KilA-N domain-containing protein [Alphaproteobacteria bacterium]|nr:KilA-N domain-containing protein [Alphaproteobacteria bacterium]MBU2380216.1 KilA-N domain-containing protein [Alphaproteobacteria bacterium]
MTTDSKIVQRKALAASAFPKVRGHAIRTDENGLVCLNDIYKASGFTTERRPSQWRDNASTGPIQIAVLERITGKTGNWTKAEWRQAIYADRGTNGGTYADVRLALAYAEYLNPKLALEVKEVFLRYKAADPTLADEILERATPSANEWAGTRALARSARNSYTDALRDHGAKGHDYGACTNTLYSELFDKNAKQLREAKGLPKKVTLRDGMTSPELVFVMAGETLSRERIIEEVCDGGEACRIATGKSARFIRQAIEADRMDRKGRQQQLI